MTKICLTALLALAVVLTAQTSVTTQAEEKTKPEDRDWASYVYDSSTTLQMNDRCLEGYRVLEKRLDQVFGQLLSEIDDEADVLAKKTQEHWQAYALSKRSFDADIYRGGTLAGPTAGVSYIHELCRRIKELNQAIEYHRPH